MSTLGTGKARLTPPGLPVSLDYPDVPVGAILLGAARRWPGRVAYHLDGSELTFADVLARTSRFAHALGAAGIGRGDVVAVHLPNCLEYPIAYYGTLLAAGTFSPANPQLPPTDLAFQLTDCAAAAVVTSRSGAAVLNQVRHKLQAKLILGIDTEPGTADVAFDDFLAEQPAQPPRIPLDVRNDLAHLAYTGGTTATSWSTPCNTPAGATAECPHWTATAAWSSTRSDPPRNGPYAWAPPSWST